MSIETTEANLEEKFNRINIYLMTKNVIGEINEKIRLPSKFFFLGNLPRSRETFMVKVKLKYNKKNDNPEFNIVNYYEVATGIENSDLLQEINDNYKTPILVDDNLANEIFGDNRDPKAVQTKYRLPDGNEMSVFMPSMKRVLH